MRQIVFPALVAFLALSAPVWANQKAKAYSDKDEVQIVEAADCILRDDKRRLEIHTNGPGCTLQYFKFSKAQEIAVSRNGVDLCKSVLAKTSKNLEASGYQCEKR